MTNHDTPHIIQKRCNERQRALRQEIGAKIHHLHRHRDMTLHKLSRKSGLSLLSLDYLERGHGEVNLYHLIAQALKVPETYFLGESAVTPSIVAMRGGRTGAGESHPADRDP